MFVPPLRHTAAMISLGLVLAASPARADPAFADVAELTIAAPVIVQATITKAERIADRDSPGLAPGSARILVTAALDAALTAPGPVPPQLSWLWDSPLDARGKPPKPKGQKVMAWLAPPDAAGKTRLAGPDAQQPWTPALDAQVRAIATDARSGQVPVITGVSNGFRADGTVPGESESQFFLSAADGRGATLVVTARPGAQRRITLARGDVIDESAATVRPGTLLWYRLACTLPSTLPPAAGGADPALAADWQAAIASLGPCGRSRPAR
ncbi:hypothetical protein [Polymorphobacter fuscus]|uniref:Uncharacterized protein n=1 Tax=Sandarakinorhabdus fusca TaxID=1439888 RepID=A0A7C9LEU0_9SPHN|nr:hypothetical protein [Polymorphobacter fuscus]KAB7648651.1 hypothetical protein F9290_02905 [Polymorphobacter fuscus]MQT16207.1 hypothetical protein [Polymorphobacter fuscus]NJC07508.1 hypothetical protein [Polymorphobacter fuscus]